MHNSTLLLVLLGLPLVTAIGLAVARASDATAKNVAILVMGLETILATVLTLVFHRDRAGYDFNGFATIAKPLGLHWNVGVDGISLFLVLLTAIVGFLALAGATPDARSRNFVVWMLVLMTATMGAFAARDLLLFFLFFELTLIPSYFMIAGWGGPQRTAAALKFFVYTFFGSGFLLVGLIYLGLMHQSEFGGDLTFATSALTQTTLSHATVVWLAVGFLVAFGIKSPLFPLHTWSPSAYAEAPAAGSMVLSALLAKLGTYGLLRYVVFLLPGALHTVRPYVLTLAVIGILYGSALAATSRDLKRLIAYSSLAQVGFIILGLFAGSAIATNGAVLLMFNHGIIVAGLFLLGEFLRQRRGSTLIADLRGLQAPAPVLAALFTVVMLASIGLPGLSGFISEFLVLIGSFQTHPWWAVVASLGVIVAALYLLWAYQRVFHGEVDDANASVADATTRERLLLVPVIALVVVLGVYPSLLTRTISPATTAVVAHATPQGVNR
jgi:NADH-quinone oxidoreductase subunit M